MPKHQPIRQHNTCSYLPHTPIYKQQGLLQPWQEKVLDALDLAPKINGTPYWPPVCFVGIDMCVYGHVCVSFVSVHTLVCTTNTPSLPPSTNPAGATTGQDGLRRPQPRRWAAARAAPHHVLPGPPSFRAVQRDVRGERREKRREKGGRGVSVGGSWMLAMNGDTPFLNHAPPPSKHIQQGLQSYTTQFRVSTFERRALMHALGVAATLLR